MVLCEKKRMDGKCRLQIPTEYIIEAGGKPDGTVYVSFHEETKEIRIIIQPKNAATAATKQEA